jgi:hypothetical protein
MFSKVVRRIHMYAALFLAPWMLMYALSTIVMNHRASFQEQYGGTLVNWVIEREQQYTSQLDAAADARAIGRQIMRDLRLDGHFNVNMSRDRKKLTLVRTDPVTPRRITYTPDDGKLVVEKQELRAQPFLESLHRRRGFQSGSVPDILWAISVDLVIVTMVVWVLTGLWMWWELKITRRLGAICLMTGLALFALFLFTI